VQTNAGQTSRAHCDGDPIHYERHRPEQTALYRLVQQHAQSFFAQAEEATVAGLPQFVKDELDAFLEYGILAHGFLRLRCADCGHDKLLAFSCKRRGFCPSCGARRMSQTAPSRPRAWLRWTRPACPGRPVRSRGRRRGRRSSAGRWRPTQAPSRSWW